MANFCYYTPRLLVSWEPVEHGIDKRRPQTFTLRPIRAAAAPCHWTTTKRL